MMGNNAAAANSKIAAIVTTLPALLALLLLETIIVVFVQLQPADGLPEHAFWDNDWPSDLRRVDRENWFLPVDNENDEDEDDEEQFVFPSDGLENPHEIVGQTSLNTIHGSAEALADAYNDVLLSVQQGVEVRTWDGSWIGNVDLPGAALGIPEMSLFQMTVASTWNVKVHYYDGSEDVTATVSYGEKLILVFIGGAWLDEVAFWSLDWTPSPTPSPTGVADNQNPPLLEGTVLFGQSQIFPSKHRVAGDRQPHVTALRKTLVLMKPHDADDGAIIEMTVRDGEGNLLSDPPIEMETPEDIPKHEGWVDLGDFADITADDFPDDLDDPYRIVGQSNLEAIGYDETSAGLTSVLNTDGRHEVEIETWNGSWVRNIFFPRGTDVPDDSVIKIVCNSGYNVNAMYRKTNDDNGNSPVSWRTKTLSNGNTAIWMLVGGLWVAPDDLDHNAYVFGHGFYSATLDLAWVKPGMTLEFVDRSDMYDGEGEEDRPVGILDEIDVGGVTELTITCLDAGFLTEPRGAFTFKDDVSAHREYFETAPLSRLIVAQYEPLHLTEVMLPDGTLYDTVSDVDGGWHSGDMRQHTGKILLSHGLDLANYGIHSSKSTSESSHPFTVALLAAHNTVGMYQNGRIVHGGSGGNGMITLDSSVGNEMSHEVGHNYGLGHYPGKFDGSVHRPPQEINSGWGWDSSTNTLIPNFASGNTGISQCLEGECQGPYLGKYKYGTDSMAGGSPNYWGLNRFTMYTPYVTQIIQEFLEGRAVFDPDSATGYSKYDSFDQTMKDYANNNNGQKVPTSFRIPVTTIVGYYETDSNRGLPSYVFPALHGAYGFAYSDEGDNNAGQCRLVVETNNAGQLVYALATSKFATDVMNKFHVNVPTEDEPYNAAVYCNNIKLAERALDGPDPNHPPLQYTLHGAPFDDSTPAPVTPPPTDSPTLKPVTPPPTDLPTPKPVTPPPTEPPTPKPVTPPPTEPPTPKPVTPPPTDPPTPKPVTPPPTEPPTPRPKKKCKDKKGKFKAFDKNGKPTKTNCKKAKKKNMCKWVDKNDKPLWEKLCPNKCRKKIPEDLLDDFWCKVKK